MSDDRVVRVDGSRAVRAAARKRFSATGAVSTAVFAAILAFAVNDRATAQPAPSTERSRGTAEGDRASLREGPSADTTAAPVFELARRAIRTRSRRAQAEDPWTVALRISGDGAWTRPRRSGQLTPAQIAELRAAIARSVRVSDPATPLYFGPSPPTIEERVTWGGRTAIWPRTHSGWAPGRDMRHLIELADRLTREQPLREHLEAASAPGPHSVAEICGVTPHSSPTPAKGT